MQDGGEFAGHEASDAAAVVAGRSGEDVGRDLPLGRGFANYAAFVENRAEQIAKEPATADAATDGVE